MVPSLRIASILLLALSLPAGLGACGNTGDLYLPPPPVTQTPESAPQTLPQTLPQTSAPATDAPGKAATTTP